jgi:hypothetical protein
MKLQILRTDQGEELVVLSRRDYDILLARLGDEEAEDRMTLKLAGDVRREIAAGEESLLSLDDFHRGDSSAPNSSGK